MAASNPVFHAAHAFVAGIATLTNVSEEIIKPPKFRQPPALEDCEIATFGPGPARAPDSSAPQPPGVFCGPGPFPRTVQSPNACGPVIAGPIFLPCGRISAAAAPGRGLRGRPGSDSESPHSPLNPKVALGAARLGVGPRPSCRARVDTHPAAVGHDRGLRRWGGEIQAMPEQADVGSSIFQEPKGRGAKLKIVNGENRASVSSMGTAWPQPEAVNCGL